MLNIMNNTPKDHILLNHNLSFLFIVFDINCTILRLLIYVELEILNSSEGKQNIASNK